jgi:predicted transcriptional regulator
MRGYWQRFSPRGGFEDFLAYWRQPTPYRWQILGVSVALTFTVMVLFIPESQRAEPRRPDVTYISTFEPGRTDAEIMASNLENQERQNELQAQREALEERKKELYRRLGRATGIDVDAMEEQIAREQAAEQAAAAAAAAEQARSTGEQ